VKSDIPVYADALLLIEAIERHDPTDSEGIETPALVNPTTFSICTHEIAPDRIGLL
jgi:hypothetical protein